MTRQEVAVAALWLDRGRTAEERAFREAEQARGMLARGRHAEALEAVRRARRALTGDARARLALVEWDVLFGLRRFRESLALASRALARSAETDTAIRLRIARGLSLWSTGRVAPGRAEVRRALARAGEPLTRARAFEALALFASKDLDLEAARGHLREARRLYEEGGSPDGLARVLEREASVWQHAGGLEKALAVQEQRVEVAASTPRTDLLALARADRGSLLTALGRWAEARADLEAAADGFRALADPREHTVAGQARACLDLATGELASARAALERARETNAERGDTRSLAEALILTSDLHLTLGEPEAAERTAVEALGLHRLNRDADGECRSRIRRALAFLALGRVAEARREARRARKGAGPTRPDLEALAEMVLGRVLLRIRPEQAAPHFEAAMERASARPVFAHLGRLGRALARRARPDDPEVAGALAGLEAWGDGRLLAFAQSDVRHLLGPAAVRETSPAAVPTVQAEGVDAAAAIVDAAAALLAGTSYPAGWILALRAIRSALPWHRAAVVGNRSFVLRADTDEPQALRPEDLACELAARAASPMALDLVHDAVLRGDPTRVLHRLGAAFVAPVAEGLILYLDTREERGLPSGRDLGLVIQLARLLAAHPRVEETPEEPSPAFAGILGSCEAMRDLFREMGRVAVLDAPVHVYGETGTGKERVARALHGASRRARGRFVAVNASSLSDDLFESEMFGHVRGSFTGAMADRHGFVADAEAGTLFLDEVTDLSGRAQAKLLRFLQEGEYRRVGENLVRRADVRVLTASNVSLEERVGDGRFRPDLMYRLNKIELRLPPLRERGSDVLMLARHFLSREAARAGRPVPAVPPELGRVLAAHPWPGNIRELENEMGRLMVRAPAGPLRKEMLSPGLLVAAPRRADSLKAATADFERGYIARALRTHGGNRAHTACALGVTRQALVAKIARLGIG
jgi:DNA-binding NtrC family response regulator/tetratricopeptide (TPR) repeat protein